MMRPRVDRTTVVGGWLRHPSPAWVTGAVPAAALAWGLLLAIASDAARGQGTEPGPSTISLCRDAWPTNEGYEPEEAAPGRADTLDTVDDIAPNSLVLMIDGHPLRIPYYANRELDDPGPGTTRLVLVIHGTLRNADDYFTSMTMAADSAGAASATMVVAPQFLTEADLDGHNLDDDYAFWAYMGWRQGDASLNTIDHPRPASVSSFAVADTILARLAPLLPELAQVVVTGHSAGGQFTNRFAAGSAVEELFTTGYGVPVRYVVANPSSYLYFDPKRWIMGTAYFFDLPPPETLQECPGYDLYKYGLQDPNPYMFSGDETLRTRYSQRDVGYLLGSLDTNPFDTYLDTTCPAMLQGNHRLERGIVYWHHLADTFGSEIHQVHRIAVVPGVGHDHRGIYTSQCGLAFIFDAGACETGIPQGDWTDLTTPLLRIPAGRAGAWSDYDADGDIDLFVAAKDQTDLLARNDHGLFADATPGLLSSLGFGVASRWGDYDNDGDPDLYVVQWRDGNRLFRNDGGAFMETTAAPVDLDGDCTDASWADADGDGNLDLYVTCTNGEANHLFLGDGAGGFVDVTAPPLSQPWDSQCGIWGDYDSDGDLDLFVVNSGHRDALLRNDGGAFSDVTSHPLDDPGQGASAAWGDYDNDGDLDLYLVKWGNPNVLYRNDGAEFTETGEGAILDMRDGRSASWADVDLDGDLDLYLANNLSANRLFYNEGDGHFRDGTAYPLDDAGQGSAVSWADFDRDGDPDLYLSNRDGANRLFRNETTGRWWLQVELHGTSSNASALGAWVRVVAGPLVQVRQIGTGDGRASQSDPAAFFGLGAEAWIDTVEVRWPSGDLQRFTSLPAGARMIVVEGTPPAGAGEPAGTNAPSLHLVAHPNPFTTGVILQLQGAIGPVSLEIHDAAGRRVRTLIASDAAGTAWNGRDSQNRPLPSGVYFIRPATRAGSPLLRLVRVR